MWFRPPRSRATNRIFLSDARVLFGRVSAHAELFTALGLGTDLLAAMEAALQAFEETGTTATDGHDGHRQARELLMETVLDCMRLVGVLDTFNQSRYAESPAMLEAWAGVHDVYGRSSKPAPEEESGVIGTLPPAPTAGEVEEEAA